jgi:hypothetical protein
MVTQIVQSASEVLFTWDTKLAGNWHLPLSKLESKTTVL